MLFIKKEKENGVLIVCWGEEYLGLFSYFRLYRDQGTHCAIL
jgi:hypothetical protein